MNALTNKVAAEAMLLPSNERIILVDELIKSLNLPLQDSIDKAWAIEAEKRVEELNNGTAEAINGEEVFRKIRSQY
ncbi:MAG: addiction module protein [Melioribacteraceae bacterium]|nr:addiction module protein [Melioribacteraceae bacterium]